MMQAQAAKFAMSFHDVCFAYQDQEVLHGLTFNIAERSMLAIVGPNGGGKTTFVKLALGLLKPTRGHIHIFGKTPHEQSQNIGYVPQYFDFDATFPVTAIDVVLMGRVERNLFGPFKSKDKALAIEALEKVSLSHLKNRPIANLSGGERQRVLIAQALVTNPKMLILDEPTANVDTKVEQQIYDLLCKLSKTMTILVVSHNLNVVTRHATHVACINRTASISSITNFNKDDLQALHRGDMTFLHHKKDCHVIDPTDAIEASHNH
ncbi:ABC transporter ATP-binding protein [Psychrobacter sp. HD31]|uniref:metal ABC transporter ATP-binding protein n=1 Tax=Psychrobacter sp. HD31 TaxID=3112003 RepID=UPI003DA59667